MFLAFKNNLGIKVCDIAFWYDRRFLSDLTLDEDDWSMWQWFRWKVSNLLFRMGCYLQND